MEQHEMNFWDLCVACAKAIGRGCKALLRLLGKMTRLTFRFWWIVIPIVGLAIGGAIYHTRPDNLEYKVNAVVYLNGPTINQFEQACSPLSGMLLDGEAPIAHYIYKKIAADFTTFRVIDAMNDGVADYIDFNCKSSSTDTVRVPMTDRLCLQFRVRGCNVHLIPKVENAVLEWFNGNEAMQASFAAYRKNLEDAVAFNHAQAVKLDSLTSCFYFNSIPQHSSLKAEKKEFLPTTVSKVDLFLDDIYDQQQKMQIDDYRLQLATAPVTLENHFAVNPAPTNGGRKKVVPQWAIIAWILGCALAEMVDKRKALYAWLKKK